MSSCEQFKSVLIANQTLELSVILNDSNKFEQFLNDSCDVLNVICSENPNLLLTLHNFKAITVPSNIDKLFNGTFLVSTLENTGSVQCFINILASGITFSPVDLVIRQKGMYGNTILHKIISCTSTFC